MELVKREILICLDFSLVMWIMWYFEWMLILVILTFFIAFIYFLAFLPLCFSTRRRRRVLIEISFPRDFWWLWFNFALCAHFFPFDNKPLNGSFYFCILHYNVLKMITVYATIGIISYTVWVAAFNVEAWWKLQYFV